MDYPQFYNAYYNYSTFHNPLSWKSEIEVTTPKQRRVTRIRLKARKAMMKLKRKMHKKKCLGKCNCNH
jgi:hypothetical protein